jgi:hypothetical protein
MDSIVHHCSSCRYCYNVIRRQLLHGGDGLVKGTRVGLASTVDVTGLPLEGL